MHTQSDGIPDFHPQFSLTEFLLNLVQSMSTQLLVKFNDEKFSQYEFDIEKYISEYYEKHPNCFFEIDYQEFNEFLVFTDDYICKIWNYIHEKGCFNTDYASTMFMSTHVKCKEKIENKSKFNEEEKKHIDLYTKCGNMSSVFIGLCSLIEYFSSDNAGPELSRASHDLLIFFDTYKETLSVIFSYKFFHNSEEESNFLEFKSKIEKFYYRKCSFKPEKMGISLKTNTNVQNSSSNSYTISQNNSTGALNGLYNNLPSTDLRNCCDTQIPVQEHMEELNIENHQAPVQEHMEELNIENHQAPVQEHMEELNIENHQAPVQESISKS